MTQSEGDSGRPLRLALAKPFQQFFHTEASSGVLLLVATAAALFFSNTGLSSGFSHLWESRWGIAAGPLGFYKDLAHWINDGLMALFFLMVGLEIKRELLVGELAEFRKALLPLVAAVGGMAVPAAVFVALNAGTVDIRGWGIPTATDIAFSLGILSLVGKRAPPSLRVFLAAFAIADDLGAVVVISLFYTSTLSLPWLGGAALVALFLFALNRLAVQRLFPYLAGGVLLWFCLLQSGVHATVAGVLLALLIPSRSALSEGLFSQVGQRILDAFDQAQGLENHPILNPGRQQAVHTLERALAQVEPPVQRLERKLHPWVSFLIMPLFALANAGVPLAGAAAGALGSRVFLGVLIGLAVGKPIGIVLAALVARAIGVVQFPSGMGLAQLSGAGLLGGIGFTMSLFIAGLAFTTLGQLDHARLAILAASALSALMGAAWLATAGRVRKAGSQEGQRCT